MFEKVEDILIISAAKDTLDLNNQWGIAKN